jgi:hypothetical protein
MRRLFCFLKYPLKSASDDETGREQGKKFKLKLRGSGRKNVFFVFHFIRIQIKL